MEFKYLTTKDQLEKKALELTKHIPAYWNAFQLDLSKHYLISKGMNT